MALPRNKTAFSPNGQHFSYSSPDGCLKIWETSSNVLKQEYTPTSHLSATCSALSWSPCKHYTHPGKKAKRSKSENHVLTAVNDLQLIAMGTLTGEILLYSLANGDLHSQLTGGHSDVVNDICWLAETDSLFSCSSDQHIVNWTISTGKIKAKWKADKEPIYAICAIDSNNLLSSSSCILWWNINEQAIIKKFSGHATEVFQLLPVSISEKSDPQYFISSAIGDRVINAWQLSETNSKNAVASFSLSDEPENLEVSQTLVKDQPLLVIVVTKEGSFHLFEHIVNGKRKKPLQPKVIIQITSNKSNSKVQPHQVPILSAKLSDDLDSCILVYGSFLKPIFEKIFLKPIFEKVDTTGCRTIDLIRDISLSASVSLEDGITMIKQPDKSNVVKLLAPGHMAPLKPLQSLPKKRKQKELDIKELPMEERLNALDLSKTPTMLDEQEPAINSDSMVHLLLQGLQSKDNKLLNTVWQCDDETIIRNTIIRLPIQCITLVLKELHKRLNKQEQGNHPCLRWMKGVLSVHLPYLMSCKDIDEYLGPISQLLEARVETFSKMSQLKGCLEILLTQIIPVTENTLDTSAEPLVSYQSDSSEESDSNEADNNENCSVAEDVPSEEIDTSNSENEMEL